MSITGFFLIDKPIGPTSHDVVDVLRKISNERTIGHAGTLDPLASGLLIMAIGREFTKQIDRFKNLDKVYEAEITLGQNSNTYDAEGELTKISDKRPDDGEIKNVLQGLVGRSEQPPPIFSAKKIHGQSAYKLARQGKVVELKPATIQIYNIDLIDYRYPKLIFSVTVSAGTYIRSLAYDIGQRMGTGAYLSNLRRTAIGDWLVTRAINLNEIESVADLERGRIKGVV